MESAKKCVTTYLPNELALKIDDAEASDLYSTVGVTYHRCNILQRVGGREGGCATLEVIPGETTFSADLGCSSKYSNENFEGRSGKKVPCEQHLDMG